MIEGRRDLAVLAIHEAGHAVAALATGCVFREVNLLPTDDWDAVLLDVDAPTFTAQAMTVLAGTVAETTLFPNDEQQIHAEQDMQMLMGLLADASVELGLGGDASMAYVQLEHRTRELVGARQREIRQLAALLRDRTAMTYDEVRAVFPGAPVAVPVGVAS